MRKTEYIKEKEHMWKKWPKSGNVYKKLDNKNEEEWVIEKYARDKTKERKKYRRMVNNQGTEG